MKTSDVNVRTHKNTSTSDSHPFIIVILYMTCTSKINLHPKVSG